MATLHLPLFVFGTLRRGHCNSHYLDGRYERVVPAVLRDYIRLHPLMIAPQPGGAVDGELFFIRDDVYHATLAGCDELEEIPPGQLIGADYERRQIPIETADGTVTAWAYVQSDRTPLTAISESPSVATMLERLRAWLASQSIPFREVHHEPTRTSEESARARGEPLHLGGKALLLKGDAEFALFVLPADRQLDSNAIRQHFGWKKLRFATPEELMELTGLVPGSVPPFGSPILPFDLYLDDEIPQNERIAFNAGALTDSMILATSDYLQVAQPREVFRFGKGEP